jgi:hypothetical protein
MTIEIEKGSFLSQASPILDVSTPKESETNSFVVDYQTLVLQLHD